MYTSTLRHCIPETCRTNCLTLSPSPSLKFESVKNVVMRAQSICIYTCSMYAWYVYIKLICMHAYARVYTHTCVHMCADHWWHECPATQAKFPNQRLRPLPITFLTWASGVFVCVYTYINVCMYVQIYRYIHTRFWCTVAACCFACFFACLFACLCFLFVCLFVCLCVWMCTTQLQ